MHTINGYGKINKTDTYTSLHTQIQAKMDGDGFNGLGL